VLTEPLRSTMDPDRRREELTESLVVSLGKDSRPPTSSVLTLLLFLNQILSVRSLPPVVPTSSPI
ncbi:hypothetical protein H0H93_011916, partial [Arthromyces matolae]